MRAAALLLAAAILVGLGAAILAGGRLVMPEAQTVAQDDAETEITTDPATAAIRPPEPRRSPAESRLVAPKVVAPPQLELDELRWAEPREPLSQLGLALPPKPKPRDDWDGTTLYRPVATASGIFEAMGYSVTIAGAQPVQAEEECMSGGVSWRCGLRARTAFRLWLRGRALVCALPEGAAKGVPVEARCRLGKQDAGAWLVANGWARAAPGGPYVEAEEVARKAGMGIFGPPPDLSGLPSPVSGTATRPTGQPAPSE